MKISDYVVNYLANLGIKHVFVVTGAAIADMIDAFTRNENIEYIAVMHEQTASFASETLTKVSGNLGVSIATSGPGGTNLLTGIANCWYDSIPNLFITGQINSAFIKSDPSIRQVGFQENDIVAMAKPITKYSAIVTDPNKIKWFLEKAVFESTNGRPGPVLIDIPVDIQKQEIDPDRLESFKSESQNNFNMDSINEAVDEYLNNLNDSKRPVLLIGGGIRLGNAIKEIRELGEILKIPCLPTWNALYIFDSEYQYYRGRVGTYGGPGRNFSIQNSDLLLTIGCRISGRITGGVVNSFARGAKKFIVDVDKANLDPDLQEVKGDVNIFSDAKLFIKTMLDKAKKRETKKFDSWLDRTRVWLDKYDPVLPEYYETKGIVNPYVFIAELSKQLKSKDVIVADCGGNVVVTNQAFKTKYGQRLCSSNGNSPMGYSFAGAIGAYYAQKDENINIICLISDGGFNMNIQDLQTVKLNNLPIKTFIMNNHVYGIIKAYQDTNLEGRYEAAGPIGYSPPDFVKIVNAYDISTETITNHSELEKKIKRVLNHKGPIVCDINMHEHYKYEPRIFGWKTPIEDMYPYLPREEFRNNMYIEPVEGWEKPILPQNVKKTME
jgi:acetolactate synthase-1/2/3 large subunit